MNAVSLLTVTIEEWQMSDGQEYIRFPNGSWIKMTPWPRPVTGFEALDGARAAHLEGVSQDAAD